MNIKIIDATSGEGIPAASLSGIKSNGDFSGTGSAANSSGVVSINYEDWNSKGIVSINITSVGYIPSNVPLSSAMDNSTIELERSVNELGGVTVTSHGSKTAIIVALVILSLTLLLVASKSS